MKWMMVGLLAIVLSGCMTTAAPRYARVASLKDVAGLCKHCRCYMPRHVDPESPCTVCHCKLKAHQCVEP